MTGTALSGSPRGAFARSWAEHLGGTRFRFGADEHVARILATRAPYSVIRFATGSRLLPRSAQSVSGEGAPVDSEPLPCPFCGEAGVCLTVGDGRVVCDGCTATGPIVKAGGHEDEDAIDRAAVDAWNQRGWTVDETGARR